MSASKASNCVRTFDNALYSAMRGQSSGPGRLLKSSQKPGLGIVNFQECVSFPIVHDSCHSTGVGQGVPIKLHEGRRLPKHGRCHTCDAGCNQRGVGRPRGRWSARCAGHAIGGPCPPPTAEPSCLIHPTQASAQLTTPQIKRSSCCPWKIQLE